MLAATAPELLSGYPAYDRPPSDAPLSAALGRTSLVTLLGDAAHCMSPFKGQGANQALLDAVNFAEQLVREFDPRRREQPTDGRTGGEGEGEADGDGGARAAAADGHAALDPVAARSVRACRAYEVEMMTRTRSKVESSFAAVATLHTPAFLQPEHHVGRKGQSGAMLQRVRALRAARVGAWDAEGGQLDALLAASAEEDVTRHGGRYLDHVHPYPP